MQKHAAFSRTDYATRFALVVIVFSHMIFTRNQKMANKSFKLFLHFKLWHLLPATKQSFGRMSAFA